jgi:hypothetical protein
MSFLDYTDFSPTSMSSWISLLNFMPRFPYLYVADAITSCFIVRSGARIDNPLLSFLLGFSITTFSDNCDALLNNRKLASFEHPFLLPVFACVWLAFNLFPFDLIYRLSKYVTFIGAFVNGFLAGRDVTRGVDLAVTHYPTSWVPVIAVGVCFGAGKHVLMHVYSVLCRQRARSAGPIIFGVAAAALGYYWFTDLGHISNRLWFDKEAARLVVLIVLSLFGFVHSAVKDSAFTAFHDVVGDAVAYFVPYYGAMWTPRMRAPARPVDRKLKTE